MEDEKIKKIVREEYAKIAISNLSCCSPAAPSCCNSDANNLEEISKNLGYTDKDLDSVPQGANLGLGCGNPVALASLKEGETILDLGSGAGIDCFLAAKKVGKTGKVIGVDMTPEMVSKARESAVKSNIDNIEFRLGELENLPVANDSVDVIISNCVINLVPDKTRAFQESWRVLKPGGRIMISDIVLLKQLPKAIMDSIEVYISCVSGAVLRDTYVDIIKKAGFENINILDQTSFPIEALTVNPNTMEIIKNLGIPLEELKDLANSVVSVKIEARKPIPITIQSKSQNKIKVDIYVPLNTCACFWDQFMNRVFAEITPYIKYIDHDTKSLNSEEARRLNLNSNCVVIDGEKKISSSFILKRELPKILREKGIIK